MNVKAQEFLRRNLYSSVSDAFFYSLMVGLGESYFGAFAVAVGYSELVAGLASTLPLIGGGLLQLFTPHGVKWLGSYRRWVVAGAILQGLSFIPFAISAYLGAMPVWFFFLVGTLYWSFFMGTVPAWNAWLHSLVPNRIRTRFFSRRNFLSHSATLLALIISGIALEFGRAGGHVLKVFSFLFLLSAFLRFISSFFLWRQTEDKESVEQLKIVPLKNVWGNFLHDRYGKILFFVLFFKMAVYFSAPFFTPYMLKDLKMSYWVYMMILSASLVGKMFIMQMISRFSKKMNYERLLLFASWGIVLIPIFWTFSRNSFYLIPLEVCSGMLWGCFDLGLFLTIFNHIPEDEQTSVLTSFNFLHMIAIILGTSLGALTFDYLALEDFRFYMIFGLSGLLRFFCLPLFPGVLEKTRERKSVQILFRPFALLPGAGSLAKFIVFVKNSKKPDLE